MIKRYSIKEREPDISQIRPEHKQTCMKRHTQKRTHIHTHTHRRTSKDGEVIFDYFPLRNAKILKVLHPPRRGLEGLIIGVFQVAENNLIKFIEHIHAYSDHSSIHWRLCVRVYILQYLRHFVHRLTHYFNSIPSLVKVHVLIPPRIGVIRVTGRGGGDACYDSPRAAECYYT
jgi:hypothetical protein